MIVVCQFCRNYLWPIHAKIIYYSLNWKQKASHSAFALRTFSSRNRASRKEMDEDEQAFRTAWLIFFCHARFHPHSVGQGMASLFLLKSFHLKFFIQHNYVLLTANPFCQAPVILDILLIFFPTKTHLLSISAKLPCFS